MPIGISAEHDELAGSLRKWAESAGAIESVRAAEEDPGLLGSWAGRYAEMGLASIALPAPYGGEGTVLDQAVALEAAAGALVPGPLLSTTVAGLLVDDAELRSGIAEGSVSVGLGLDGVVLDGAAATHVLLARAGDFHLVARDDVDVVPAASPDPSRTIGTVTGLPSSARQVTVDEELGQDLALALAAAEASGVARWCVGTAVDYAGVREQFGQKIGAFQAIKHLCAQMLETSEAVTAAAWDAALAVEGEDPAQRRLAALVAATTCFDGAVSTAKDCIQVLGGIGFTFEHDAHLYLRRALLLRSFFGGSRVWAGELARHAATGVRRSSVIDFQGRDEEYRSPAREQAERIARLPDPDRRTALADTGLLAPHWAAPYGLGADAVQQLVIDEELARAGVERPDLKIGAWAAPTILQHGNDAQRDRFLGPTLHGEIVWCQLFSEPGAGSDLASLRTKAVRDDAAGGWRLTGQKVWTSLAQQADWGICLARTAEPAESGGRPHAGITYFLVDMRSPGIEIRPLRELTGEAMFNEVFLDDVLVPDDCVVGEVGGGWKLAVTTLANERVAMAGSRLGDSVERAVDLAGGDGDAAVGSAVALATVVKLLGVRSTLRSLAGQGPGAESSVAKLLGVRSRQDSAELVVELLGRRALSGDDLSVAATHELLLTRCLSIAGGTTQVLRNVVGERVLGLPRG
ncbi:MAG TPA: acyl-CoA dehydrogenase family protein [Marmoricola sp.]|nr:acyl-CoA dehydrogenase family protein [Marmoricola sp.]